MATMLDGESYLGRVLVRKLSPKGEVTMYCWPMRCLKSKIGGPTFGVDVKGEEIIRFDPHGSRGHWHKGGYDKLGAGGSHVDFPKEVAESGPQVEWSLSQVKAQTKQLLADAGHPDAAALVDDAMLDAAIEAVKTHLKSEGDLRPKAISEGLVNA